MLKLLTSLSIILGGFLALYQFRQKRKLEKFDLFIKYRERLKSSPATSKIISHIQEWQLNDEERSNINTRGITISDFYHFIGFFEEISLLNQEKLISDKLVREMFGFYALEIANNEYYWNYFGEDYNNDQNWINYRKLIDKLKLT